LSSTAELSEETLHQFDDDYDNNDYYDDDDDYLVELGIVESNRFGR